MNASVSTPPDAANTAPAEPGRVRHLASGLFFGVIFGFLLQKGGVAKYEVLIGQLLLRDFTVLKVMLSAVLVGMVGIHLLHRAGKVQLHPKETKYASNIIGGLIFGIGFGLAAYCPGTNAAALGQGNYDALAVAAGLLAGSYLFAEVAGWLRGRLDPIGDRGKLTIPALLHKPPGAVIPVIGVILTLILLAVAYWT